jgi:hypothetical protein
MNIGLIKNEMMFVDYVPVCCLVAGWWRAEYGKSMEEMYC